MAWHPLPVRRLKAWYYQGNKATSICLPVKIGKRPAMSQGKRILIIMGHPRKDSFCAALAQAYHKGALEGGAEIKELVLCDLQFDLDLHTPGARDQALEPDLEHAQALIHWAQHLVFVYPNWWGTMPARMKGFFDRVLQPGFAFRYRPNSIWWDKLLAGRSAHLIVTMNTPPPAYWVLIGAPGHRAMKNAILGFAGIKPVRITSVGVVRRFSEEKRLQWIKKVHQAGIRMQ
jgi:NAD(P)H dehydrogenase (quinone)